MINVIVAIYCIGAATNGADQQNYKTFRNKSSGIFCIVARDECPNERITFWLYKNTTLKKGARQTPLRIDPLNLQNQDFEPHRPLKILLHGFTGNRDRTPNSELRQLLLDTQPVHVLSVDYESLARFPCYDPWALANAPIVAKCLSQLINQLLSSVGIYASNEIHLIGFSLGGQIAGLTSNWLEHKLHRITGLDPAGPGFRTESNDNRLDSSDADFVDVIHTDIAFNGIANPSGHADFYPNLDHVNQNGCDHTFGIFASHLCNHYRSAMYYAESLITTTGFWSYPCEGLNEYLQHNCKQFSAQDGVLMGYFVPENASGAYFLTTNAYTSYARGRLTELEGTE